MRIRKCHLTKQQVEQCYLSNKSLVQWAKELNCTADNIDYFRKFYNLPYKKKRVRIGPKQNLVGQKFFRLKVIKELNESKMGETLWLCICDCGKEHITYTSRLTTKRLKSCGCQCQISARKSNGKYFQEISGRYLCALKTSAKKRKLEYLITNEYIWNLFIKQNRKCAISGLNIKFGYDISIKEDRIQTASLDRIDSSKGYIEGNVQWVHKDVNRMKYNFTQEHLIKMCRAIIEYQDANIM